MSIYFPILPSQEPDPIRPEWPFIENKFENRYSQRMSYGFKIQHWKAKFFLLDSWTKHGQSKGAWRQGNYSVGDYIAPGNSHVYMCAVAGATGGSQPTWATTHEGTQSDGTVTWVCFPDNQIQAVKEFIDNRQGHVVAFFVWVPSLQAWVQVVLPVEPPEIIPITGGDQRGATVEIEFTQEF